MIRPLAILGSGPAAADLALRRVLAFKESRGPLIVLDWIGRAAPLLHAGNEGQASTLGKLILGEGDYQPFRMRW